MSHDLTTGEILARLSAPATDAFALNRRRFLQAALGVGAVAAAQRRTGFAFAGGSALPPSAGVLVVVLLAGGNDGLNMVAPIDDPDYARLRGTLALAPQEVHRIGSGLALHPTMVRTKQRFDAGDVAVLQGVGCADPSLSHFESMHRWLSGWSGGGSDSGWVGRFLASLPAPDPLGGVVLGPSVPLHFQGASMPAVALPRDVGDAVGWLTPDSGDGEYHTLGLLASYNDVASQRGPLADLWNARLGDLVAVGVRSQPVYATPRPEDGLAADLTLAARLVNLGLGTRVIGVTHGDFDTHASQSWRHENLLARLDAGIEAFFATLDPALANSVVLLTISEFGRRAKANGSGGTDHGSANSLLAIGGSVKGGIYGSTPSLRDLDRDGNLKASTDFRTVYATALRWLGGDADAVLGGTYGDLGFLGAPPTPSPMAPGGSAGAPLPAVGAPAAFVPMAPVRVLDTRGVDGPAGGRKPAAGDVVTIALGGLPDATPGSVAAVALNVTAADAEAPGYVTVWPGGEQPTASNVNIDAAGQTRPNLVTTRVASDGTARLYTSTSAHLIADASGYYRMTASAAAGRFVALAPTRLLDTRGGGAIGYAGEKPAAGAVVDLAIAGRAGVPVAGASAVVLNVTATDTGGYGYVTAFPGGTVPVASNLNVQRSGQTIANQVIVQLGSDGAVRLYTYEAAHLVADIVGWFTDGSAPVSPDGLFTPATPYRVLDTRPDGLRATGSVLTLEVATPSQPARGARAIVLNVTAVDSQEWGYVTVFPDGDPPAASNVNVDGAAQTIANHVICPIAGDGSVRLYTSAAMHLVVDVAGWFV